MKSFILNCLRQLKGFEVSESENGGDILLSWVTANKQPKKVSVSFDEALENSLYVETDSKRYLFQSSSPLVLLKRITDFVSSGSAVTPVKSSVLPGVLRDVFMYPIGSSADGLLFKDFNGKTYICQEEAPIGLSIYKSLADYGLDVWMTSLPTMFQAGEEQKKVLSSGISKDFSAIQSLFSHQEVAHKVDMPSFRDLYYRTGLPYKSAFSYFAGNKLELPSMSDALESMLDQTYKNKNSAAVLSKFLYDQYRWNAPINQSRASYYYGLLGSLRTLLSAEEEVVVESPEIVEMSPIETSNVEGTYHLEKMGIDTFKVCLNFSFVEGTDISAIAFESVLSMEKVQELVGLLGIALDETSSMYEGLVTSETGPKLVEYISKVTETPQDQMYGEGLTDENNVEKPEIVTTPFPVSVQEEGEPVLDTTAVEPETVVEVEPVNEEVEKVTMSTKAPLGYPSIYSMAVPKKDIAAVLASFGIKADPLVYKPQVFQLRGYVPHGTKLISSFSHEHIVVSDYLYKKINKVNITSTYAEIEDQKGRLFRVASSEYAKKLLQKDQKAVVLSSAQLDSLKVQKEELFSSAKYVAKKDK